MVDHIVSGVEPLEFVRRVQAALEVPGAKEFVQDRESEATTDTREASEPTNNIQPESPVDQDGTSMQAPATGPSSSNPTTSPVQPPQRSSSSAAPVPANSNQQPPSYETSNLQSLFPDRTTHLEANRERQQATEAERLRAANERSRAPQTGAPQTARVDYAAQRRQQVAAAKKERERVLAAIEADKAARREKERIRKEAEQAVMSKMLGEEEADRPEASTRRNPNTSRRSGAAAMANIQVRLFSGRTLRSRFPAMATLGKDVRDWVDEAVAEDAQTSRPPAYIFKHIVNPLPSRSFEVAEEGNSLMDLDLLPSATLVLVPVQGGAEAYAGGGGGGLVSMAYGAASGALGLASSTVGTVAGTLGSFIGWGSSGDGVVGAGSAEGSQAGRQLGAQGRDGRGEDAQKDAASGGEERGVAKEEGRRGGNGGVAGIRVRTLADQRADEKGKQGETWYNGNQVRNISLTFSAYILRCPQTLTDLMQLSFQPKDDPDEGKR